MYFFAHYSHEMVVCSSSYHGRQTFNQNINHNYKCSDLFYESQMKFM